MRRSAGVGFRRVFPDTHDYLLRRPKAVRLHPSSKSGPDMIISCGDLRLVGATRHRKVVQNPHSILLRSGWRPWGGVPKVAPEPTPYIVLRAVWLVALRLDGMVFQNPHPVATRQQLAKVYQIDAPDGTWCHQAWAGEARGPS